MFRGTRSFLYLGTFFNPLYNPAARGATPSYLDCPTHSIDSVVCLQKQTKDDDDFIFLYNKSIDVMDSIRRHLFFGLG